MEPSGLEPLTPCMPFRRFGGQESFPGLDSDQIITNYVRRSVRRSLQPGSRLITSLLALPMTDELERLMCFLRLESVSFVFAQSSNHGAV